MNSGNSVRGRFDRKSGFRRACGGATAVEFALTTPVFLLFLYGILEFGRAMLMQGVMIYAAQEASRFAAVRPTSTTDEVRQVVVDSMVVIDSDSLSELTVSETPNADNTRTVSVTVGYQFNWLIPLLELPEIQLTATSDTLSG